MPNKKKKKKAESNEPKMSWSDFRLACKKNDPEKVEHYLQEVKITDLNINIFYHWPPGFIISLPLVDAAEYDAKECAEVLVRYGADPDLICRRYKKTARQLKPEWFEHIPKKEEKEARLSV